jgi:hypothetical protein
VARRVRHGAGGAHVFSAAIDGRVYARYGTDADTRPTVIDRIPADDPAVFAPSPGMASDTATLPIPGSPSELDQSAKRGVLDPIVLLGNFRSEWQDLDLRPLSDERGVLAMPWPHISLRSRVPIRPRAKFAAARLTFEFRALWRRGAARRRSLTHIMQRCLRPDIIGQYTILEI